MATSMQVDIAKDKKHVHSNMIFYGVLKRIWMLDYYNFNILVFKCDWVDNKNSIKVDELGFTYVELSKVGHKSDSFILTLQAKKVFYVPDQLNLKWHIVLSTPQIKYHDEENVDKFLDSQNDNENVAKLVPNIDIFDVIDDPLLTYARKYCEGTWAEKES